MSLYYMGIDPGLSGGVAVIDEPGQWLECTKLDVTEADTFSWLEKEVTTCSIRAVYIERVSAMPKQGVSSTFKFGQNYGFLRGLLTALRIPFEEVAPGLWQRKMGCLSKGDKKVTRARAQQLFPGMHVTHAIADAMLIAEFCRRVHTGSVSLK